MDTPEILSPVIAILTAFDARDAEAFVSHMTEDVLLAPSAFITGKGAYHGRDEVLAGFAEMEQSLAAAREDVRVQARRFFVDWEHPEKVLSLGQVTITRASGDSFGTEIAYLWTLRDGKVCELHTWLDHAEGLRQLREPIEVCP
jgi:ketosteroid isomerase-like protein